MAIFKSYPSASDASLYLALVPIHDELFKCKENLVFFFCLHTKTFFESRLSLRILNL
ncbi:MAG: hypothetical protein JSY10_17715 [Paenibacillus sp.]|nr:hypothetical protein [Paenibacillus sp.]